MPEVTVVRHKAKLTAVRSPDRVQPVQPFASSNHIAAAAHANQAASAVRRVPQPCCMSSTRKLARLAAPVVCAAYVAYVAVDRGYYHIERRKELDAATARAKAEAARRVAADERR